MIKRALIITLLFLVSSLTAWAAPNATGGGGAAGGASSQPIDTTFYLVRTDANNTIVSGDLDAGDSADFMLYGIGTDIGQVTVYLQCGLGPLTNEISAYMTGSGAFFTLGLDNYCVYPEAGSYHVVAFVFYNGGWAAPWILGDLNVVEPVGSIEVELTISADTHPTAYPEPYDLDFLAVVTGEDGSPMTCQFWCDCASPGAAFGGGGACGAADGQVGPQAASPVVSLATVTNICEDLDWATYAESTAAVACSRNGQEDEAYLDYVVAENFISVELTSSETAGDDPVTDVTLEAKITHNCPADVNVTYDFSCADGGANPDPAQVTKLPSAGCDSDPEATCYNTLTDGTFTCPNPADPLAAGYTAVGDGVGGGDYVFTVDAACGTATSPTAKAYLTVGVPTVDPIWPWLVKMKRVFYDTYECDEGFCGGAEDDDGFRVFFHNDGPDGTAVGDIVINSVQCRFPAAADYTAITTDPEGADWVDYADPNEEYAYLDWFAGGGDCDYNTPIAADTIYTVRVDATRNGVNHVSDLFITVRDAPAAVPVISTSTDDFTFGAQFAFDGEPITEGDKIITLTNTGTGTLTWTDGATDASPGWLDCTPSDSGEGAEGTLLAGEYETINCAIDLLDASIDGTDGLYYGEVVFSDTVLTDLTPRKVTFNMTVSHQVEGGLGNLTLDPKRIPDWSNVGVDGGIPDLNDNRATGWPVYTTLAAGTTAANINTAITNASAAYGDGREGSIVQLAAGAFSLNSQVYLKDNVVLRGSGTGSTIVTGDGTKPDPIRIQGATSGGEISIISGATRGSYDITASNAAAIATIIAGDYLELIEDFDPLKMTESTRPWIHFTGQTVRVDTKAGAILTLDRPLRQTFTKNPRVQKFNPVENAGVENFRLQYPTTVSDSCTGPCACAGYWPLLLFERSVNSWARGMYFYWGDNMHIRVSQSRDITIEGNTMDTLDYAAPTAAGGEGCVEKSTSIALIHRPTDVLVQNNIFLDVEAAVKSEVGAIGCVFAYNHSDLLDHGRSGWTHGNYPSETLFEGNSSNGHSVIDDWWGENGPRNIWFRNRDVGSRTAGLATEDLKPSKFADLTTFIANVADNYYQMTLGNCTRAKTDPAYNVEDGCLALDRTGSNLWVEKNRAVKLLIKYGDMTSTTYVDESNVCTHLDHLGATLDCAGVVGPFVKTRNRVDEKFATNYDGISPPPQWANFNIPPSLYLTSRPDWWCSQLDWPAIGADVDIVGNYQKIPAQRRHEGMPCTCSGYGCD